jgi:hypothetical protein
VRLKIEHDLAPDIERLQRVLNAMIDRHAPRGHGSEVAWSIWAAMAFDAELNDAPARAISAMHDDVVALLALEAASRGCIGKALDTTYWSQWMESDQLYGEHWLLAYEGLVRGLLQSKSGDDYVSNEPAFCWMKQNKVRFTKNFRKPTAATLRESHAVDPYESSDEEWDEEDDEDEFL